MISNIKIKVNVKWTQAISQKNIMKFNCRYKKEKQTKKKASNKMTKKNEEKWNMNSFLKFPTWVKNWFPHFSFSHPHFQPPPHFQKPPLPTINTIRVEKQYCLQLHRRTDFCYFLSFCNLSCIFSLLNSQPSREKKMFLLFFSNLPYFKNLFGFFSLPFSVFLFP